MSLAARNGSAADCTKPHRRILFSLVIWGVLFSGCMTARQRAIDTTATGLAYEQYEVITGSGSAEHQTILSGFFLGGDIAELVVVGVDENDDRRVQMYGFDGGTWVSVLDTALSRDVRFVDVANIGGRDRLITYGSGRLNWFDPDSGKESALVEVALNYNATPAGMRYADTEPAGPFDEGEIPHVDVTRDLNGDGQDDLIVPDTDGFWVFIQSNHGEFTDPVKLGPSEPFQHETAFGDTRTYGELGLSALTIPWHLSRVHEMDYDLDGRSDLVFWNEDHFDVYFQDVDGLFFPVAESFTADVPFDSDGAYSLLFGFRDKNTFALIFGLGKKTTQTMLRAVRDLNGDGVADLVIHTLEGRGLRQRSRYAVHFGKPTPGGIEFARHPGAEIQPQGKAGAGELAGYSSLWLRDFDGDDRVDFMRSDVNFGVGAMIRALFGTSISMAAEIFLMGDGAYPDRATVTHEIKADIHFRGGRDAGFFPAVLVGDVNGDGSSDLLVGKSRKELHVSLGGPELLAGQPRELAIDLPGDERNSWLVDLNRDGRQDLLMHHPSATEPHRVTMLIMR